MALHERMFDIDHLGLNFFDHLCGNASTQMESAMAQINAMRKQMYHLMPHDPLGDIMSAEIQPRVPIVEERGETKLKLEFNVQDFRPEEVQVKILGSNILQASVHF